MTQTRKSKAEATALHPAPPASDRMKTRQRVLVTSLALFNEHGPGRVTTAEIARAAGIAEGNLHYYFRKKADLLIALFEVFEADVDALLSLSIASDGPLEELFEHQRRWFRLMFAHQWFYRGTAGLFITAPGLLPRVREMTVRNRRFVTSVFERMVERKLLRITPEQVEQLLTNVWIVATYWIEYRRFMTTRMTLDLDDLEWGYAQVSAIYAPYLTREGQILARRGVAGRSGGS